jgi:hypothetical protein
MGLEGRCARPEAPAPARPPAGPPAHPSVPHGTWRRHRQWTAPCRSPCAPARPCTRQRAGPTRGTLSSAQRLPIVPPASPSPAPTLDPEWVLVAATREAAAGEEYGRSDSGDAPVGDEALLALVDVQLLPVVVLVDVLARSIQRASVFQSSSSTRAPESGGPTSSQVLKRPASVAASRASVRVSSSSPGSAPSSARRPRWLVRLLRNSLCSLVVASNSALRLEVGDAPGHAHVHLRGEVRGGGGGRALGCGGRGTRLGRPSLEPNPAPPGTRRPAAA